MAGIRYTNTGMVCIASKTGRTSFVILAELAKPIPSGKPNIKDQNTLTITIATVIYAIVPMIRMTALGISQVDREMMEAARAFGSTWWQILWKVEIPQAAPTIMAGVNQTIMMAMSMVVTCSMIGARGLGHEVLVAVQRMEIGRGMIAGLSVVILAVILDRMTQQHGKKDKL